MFTSTQPVRQEQSDLGYLLGSVFDAISGETYGEKVEQGPAVQVEVASEERQEFNSFWTNGTGCVNKPAPKPFQ